MLYTCMVLYQNIIIIIKVFVITQNSYLASRYYLSGYMSMQHTIMRKQSCMTRLWSPQLHPFTVV